LLCFVALLGFSGCDLLRALGFGEDEPAPEQPAPPPYVGKGVPVYGADNEPSIKKKFGVTLTGKAGVNAAFQELHAFIQNGGLDTATNVIQLGNYIDLEGGLTVTAYGEGGGGFSSANDWNSTITIQDADRGKLSRLIVVGINSFQDYASYVYQEDTDNPSRPHVVFQFQNIPVTRRMNDLNTAGSSTNTGGYPASEMREYLKKNFYDGLTTTAGVPAEVLWAPSRVMATADATDKKMPINDLLWLPTLYEMLGEYSVTAETQQNQPRLAYNDNSSRKKVDKSRTTYKAYWLASGEFTGNAAFYTVKTDGKKNSTSGAVNPLGVAPAFCVQ
jgi:hypothetical protein